MHGKQRSYNALFELGSVSPEYVVRACAFIHAYEHMHVRMDAHTNANIRIDIGLTIRISCTHLRVFSRQRTQTRAYVCGHVRIIM